uniref:HP domain-containing protein n=1 Tax=Anopheles quadriannulatus TaxID=34691 RepID=A0A182XLH8_ANOQN
MVTVQTASPWRPQLPLPKDITTHVQQQQRQQAMEKASTTAHKAKDAKDKKWSLGSLFRKKKKDLETDSSSEEDRKAGFVPVKSQGTLNGKRKKRSSRIVGAGFDHIVINPQQQQQQQQQQHIIPHHQHHPQQQNQYGFRETDGINTIERYPGNGSLDRRGRKTDRSSRHSKERQSSSDEESHRSSSMSRFRSDDSLGNHSAGSHRKSRTARTERYLKRMSRDDGGSPNGSVVPAPTVNRWHTQPISPSMLHGGSVQSMDVTYRRHHPHHHHTHHHHQPQQQPLQMTLRNSASLTNVPHHLYQSSSPNYAHQLNYSTAPPSHGTGNAPAAVTYENSFYIQSKASSMRDAIRSPPPIPPRDPQRRLTIGHTNEARPVSYAFDRFHQVPGNVWQSNGKCNSEDRLWGSMQPVQRTAPSAHSVTPPRATSVQPAEIQDRTFEPYEPKLADPVPTGSESSLAYTSTPTPTGGGRVGSSSRSLRADSSDSVGGGGGSRTPQQSASAFWRRIEEEQQNGSVQSRRGRATERRPGVAGTAISSRSVSTSRALEIMNRRNQELTRELDHLLDDKQNGKNGDGEMENIVSGRLYLRQTGETGANRAKSNEKLYEVKMKTAPETTVVPNKYEEHVAKTVAQGTTTVHGTHGYRRYGEEQQPPAPPMRTISKRNSCSEEELARKRKSANLEEAINELEAIYKSLKLSDEDLLERAEQRDLPTPTGFSQRARHYRYDADADEERAKAEPDVQLDDLSYRSIKRANSSIKAPETQPPFGIPVGPIPPSPNTDYLTVQAPVKQTKPRFQPQRSPDLVADDLAFRQLRKDKDLLACIDRAGVRHAPPSQSGNTSSGSDDSRQKRSTGSLSSNIYSQIQRDAAKPSGGNLEDYYKIELYAKSLREATTPGREVVAPAPKSKDTSPAKEKPVTMRPKSGTTLPKENRGAVFNLPSTLKSSSSGSPPKSPAATEGSSAGSTPTPRPRSGTEPVIVGAKHKAEFEEILNAIALEAQSTSEKLGADLAELRKETQSVSSGTSPEVKSVGGARPISKTIAPTKKEEVVVVAARATVKSQRSETPKELAEVAQAAKYCERMLRDVIEEAPKKEMRKEASASSKLSPKKREQSPIERAAPKTIVPEQPTIVEPAPSSEPSVLSGLIEQLTPAGSFEALSKRCQEQLSELEAEDEQRDERVKSSIERDYDNLVESIEPFESDTDKKSTEEEIDIIMKECGIELESNAAQKVPASAQTELKSSSETEPCPKSSSQSVGPKSVTASETSQQRATSTSPSSEGRTKTSRPSPPVSSVRLTPSDTESQYNSSEELAMIFGIKSPTPTGKEAAGTGRVPLLSLSCAKPSVPLPRTALSADPVTTGTIDEHDGGVVLSVPVPTILFPNQSLTTTTTSTVASVCAVSATNSIACKNVTTNTNTTTTVITSSDTQTHDTTATAVEVSASEEEPPMTSFYLRSSFGNHLHHSLDTIHEDLAEELEETTAANDVDSTTTDSGNVSLNDFGSEFPGSGPIDRKVTFVNEVRIGPCGTGYYPFRSELQIPEIFIEDVSAHETTELKEEEPVECDAVEESSVDDPPVETLEELSRLEAERRRLEALVPRPLDDDADRQLRYRTRGESSGSSSRSRSVGGGAQTKRKSSSSSLVQPQHVVLASGEEMSEGVHPSTTDSSSIVTLPGKPTTIPLMSSCLGEKQTTRASAVSFVPTSAPSAELESATETTTVAVKGRRNNPNRDSGGALQNLCFCLI